MQSGEIQNSQITASTWQSNFQPFEARYRRTGSWMALETDTNQWIQVDFGILRYVSELSTQSKPYSYLRVVKYKVEYSPDDIEWRFVKDENLSEVKVRHTWYKIDATLDEVTASEGK